MSAQEDAIIVEHKRDATFGYVFTIVSHPDIDAWQGRTVSAREFVDWLTSQRFPVIVRKAPRH